MPTSETSDCGHYFPPSIAVDNLARRYFMHPAYRLDTAPFWCPAPPTPYFPYHSQMNSRRWSSTPRYWSFTRSQSGIRTGARRTRFAARACRVRIPTYICGSRIVRHKMEGAGFERRETVTHFVRAATFGREFRVLNSVGRCRSATERLTESRQSGRGGIRTGARRSASLRSTAATCVLESRPTSVAHGLFATRWKGRDSNHAEPCEGNCRQFLARWRAALYH